MLHKIIAVTIIASSNAPKEQGEHGNTPPLICAYHNENLYVTLSDLREESSSTYVHVNI